MENYKSVQDLIVKAAFHDGVTTTIRANEMYGCGGMLKITFSKHDRHSTTCIDITERFSDHEEMSLYCCKDALHKLLWEPYDKIKVKEK